jgi:hypothetical protein
VKRAVAADVSTAAVAKNEPTARHLRPRATSTLAIAAALVTDLTAPALLGLEAWQFRELVKAERIPHARLGQRVIAKVEDVVVAVEQLGKRQSGAPANDDAPAPSTSGRTADGILARMGRVRTPPGVR